jgi:hypothetical protein
MAAAVVLALGLATAACGGDSSVRDDFMDGCVPEMGEPFCECVYDELRKDLTDDEIVGLGEGLSAESTDIPEEIMGAAFACISEMEIEE